jgi:hypothetical protein
VQWATIVPLLDLLSCLASSGQRSFVIDSNESFQQSIVSANPIKGSSCELERRDFAGSANTAGILMELTGKLARSIRVHCSSLSQNSFLLMNPSLSESMAYHLSLTLAKNNGVMPAECGTLDRFR